MKRLLVFLLIFFFSFLFLDFARSDDEIGFSGAKNKMDNFADKLQFSDFDTSVENVIRNVMFLVNTLFFIFMIYAGVMWLTSSGNEDKIKKAKSIIVWCAVGMVVTLGAYTITNFVLTKVTGYSPDSGNPQADTCVGRRGECLKACEIDYRPEENIVSSKQTNLGALDCPAGQTCCIPISPK